LDINRSKPLPADQFFDMTHTLNSGGTAMGQIMATELEPLLKQVQP
jgi:hypothetical protein